MPDDGKIIQPPANASNLTETIQPDAELPQDEIVRLPTGYQKIHLRPLLPKAVADTHLTRNNLFDSSLIIGGCGKPISKIVGSIDESESASGD